MTFDATILYSSAVFGEKSIYPKIGRGYAFTPDMKHEIVVNVNAQTFSQGSSTLRVLY